MFLKAPSSYVDIKFGVIPSDLILYAHYLPSVAKRCSMELWGCPSFCLYYENIELTLKLSDIEWNADRFPDAYNFFSWAELQSPLDKMVSTIFTFA